MNKITRNIDDNKMNESRSRSLDFVMNEISQEKRIFNLRKTIRFTFAPILLLIFGFILIGTNLDQQTDGFVNLSASSSETLAELSYLSSSFISSNTALSNNNLTFISNEDTTEFENEEEQINIYFDILKVFLEDNSLEDSIVITDLDNSDYEQLLSFTIDGTVFDFYITIKDELLEGELLVDNIVYILSGKYIVNENEVNISLEAHNNDDYVIIEYKNDNQEENTTKYTIKERYQGVEFDKEIKVSKELNESKVDIIENNKSYTLKKSTENGNNKYKLQYDIDGTEGEAIITESVDHEGNISYGYEVKEGNNEKVITKEKPEVPDTGNSGQDDDKGNNGNGGRNQNNQEKPINIIILDI